MTDTQINGVAYDDFHKFRIARYPSLANNKGSNFDAMMQWKDDIDYGMLLEVDEQANAKQISYAHGIELDDLGDNFEVLRNGLDDSMYQFYMKAHRLSANSKGSFSDLINIIAILLGCDPTDIRISNDRHFDSNNSLVGELNTINIDSIDITKINNPDFIPLLANELQHATLAGTKVKQIGFYESIKNSLATGVAIMISEQITI